jgi:uncharacterized protein DUF3551
MLCRRHFWNFFICSGSACELPTANATARVRIESKPWRGNADDRGEKSMRKLLVDAVVLAGLTLMSSQPAQAFPARHAFCLQGDVYPGWSFCHFDTYAQCWATAAGINAACVANPFYGARSHAYRNRPRPHAPRR